MFALVALSLLGSTAEARHGRATIDVDNVIRSTVTVWVDGEPLGSVRPFERVVFSVRPGAREIEIVQPALNCVLTDDFVHLPPSSEVDYRVDRGCGPRPVRFVRSRPRPGCTVTWTPTTFRVVRHRGPVHAPVRRVVRPPVLRRSRAVAGPPRAVAGPPRRAVAGPPRSPRRGGRYGHRR